MWKKICKMGRETCKNTKLCFSPLTCRTDQKDIDENVKKITHLENYCKQQNLDLIDNSNIKKSDLNSRGLHLHFLDYWVCATGNGFPDQSEQSKFCIVLRTKN